MKIIIKNLKFKQNKISVDIQARVFLNPDSDDIRFLFLSICFSHLITLK